jgi:hypothetical protein
VGAKTVSWALSCSSGHANPNRSMLNTYSHVAPEVSREAADRMARMLWQDERQVQAGEQGSL